MSDGILSNLPDIGQLTQSSTDLISSIQPIQASLGLLESDEGGNPLTGLFTVFTNLDGQFDIDLSALTDTLPSSLDVVSLATQNNSLQFIESISDTYGQAQKFLNTSPLAQAVSGGASLQEVALALISQALSQFDDRIAELSSGLIDSDKLDSIRATFTTISNLRTDFAGHQEDFLPFLSQYLIGADSGIFSTLLVRQVEILAVLQPLLEESLAITVLPARQALAEAMQSIHTELSAFDNSSASAYLSLQSRLNELQQDNEQLTTALTTVYGQLHTAIDNHAWETLFQGYNDLLNTVDLPELATADDLVNQLVEVIEELLGNLRGVFDIGDLKANLDSLNQSIRETFTTSPLAQIRVTLSDFLEQIRQTIESIPTETVQTTVDDILGRIRDELDDLNLTSIETSINNTFDEIDNFVSSNINDNLKTTVTGALSGFSDQIDALPVSDLLDDLTAAIGQLQTLLNDLAALVDSELSSLGDLVGRIEELSFKPLSDKVIEEIDEVKQRLAAINPNALSDVEKMAIKAALAVLEAIDLEDQVINGLKSGYNVAESKVKSACEQVKAVLDRLTAKFNEFSPANLLSPVIDGFDQATVQIEKLNARILLTSLYDQLNRHDEILQQFAPGHLLDPLQAPYDAFTSQLDRLDANNWVSPLNTLYEQIDGLIDIIDISPLLDELDNRQRQLFGNIQTAIINAVNDIDLPPPLDSILDIIQPLLEVFSEAIFGDPETELRNLNLEINNRAKLSNLFQPLDSIFGEFIGLLDNVPSGDLVDGMNSIRQGVGLALETLNPQVIHDSLINGVNRLVDLAPSQQFSAALKVSTLQMNFEFAVAGAPAEHAGEIATINGQFAALSLALDINASGDLATLHSSHQTLTNTLRSRINALNPNQAQAQFQNIKNNLDRLLPDFLRQAEPLDHSQIMLGIHGLRPSVKAQNIDDAISRFINEINPVSDALESGINDFFGLIREMITLINPLSVKDSVSAIYDTLRSKVLILDPQALADDVNDLMDQVTAPVEALNPANLKSRINESYGRAVNAVMDTVKQILDEIVLIIDRQLRQIRESVKTLLTQIKNLLSGTIDSFSDILEQLSDMVFVQILERLCKTIDNLGTSFNAELDRVRNAFDAMLAAIPLGGSTSGSATIAA